MDMVGGGQGQENSIRSIRKWRVAKRQEKENKLLPDCFLWVYLPLPPKGKKGPSMMFLLFLLQLLVQHVAYSMCFLNIS